MTMPPGDASEAVDRRQDIGVGGGSCYHRHDEGHGCLLSDIAGIAAAELEKAGDVETNRQPGEPGHESVADNANDHDPEQTTDATSNHPCECLETRVAPHRRRHHEGRNRCLSQGRKFQRGPDAWDSCHSNSAGQRDPEELDVDGTALDARPRNSDSIVLASGMQHITDEARREDAGANLQPPIHPQMQRLCR
jgi:hypothetical protein